MKSRLPIREPDSLKDRILQAASQLFQTEGYSGLSMRRVAQVVDCSQMAMYRHFANKEALVQHICAGLYTRFVQSIHDEIDGEPVPKKKLARFARAALQFAERYPEHYSLIFLVRHSDPQVVQEREDLGRRFLDEVAQIVRQALPRNASTQRVNTTLRRMLESLHGTAALRIAHPTAYGLTQSRAVEDIEAVWSMLLS